MSKRIDITVPDDLYEVLKAEASDNGTIPSRFITRYLSENLMPEEDQNGIIEESYEADPDNGKLTTYRFKQEDASIIHERAVRLGISDTAYLRKLVRSKQFNVIDIADDDIKEYLAQVGKISNSASSLVSMIKRNGNGQVYSQDIERMLELLEGIKGLCKEQVKLTYANRNKAYKAMVSKLDREIRG